MTRDIELSAIAQMDMRDAEAWETQPGTGAAGRKRSAGLRRGIDTLQAFPCLGRRKEGGRRMVTIGRYRVTYSVHPDTGSNETAGDVFVIRILGPGQMF